MRNLWYVVEKELQQLDPNVSIEETTGNKLITVYGIDTQSMNLIIVCEIESLNTKNSEKEIQYWLDNNGHNDEQFNLIKL